MLDRQLEELNRELGEALRSRDLMDFFYRYNRNSLTTVMRKYARQTVANLYARRRRLHARIARQWNTPTI